MVSPVGFGACVIPCPAQKNYELRIGDKGVLSCVYAGDTSISVPVLPVPAVQKQGPPFSYKELPNASVYQTEIDRFNVAFALADTNVDKAVKLKTAYDALQKAENARDVAPDAYQPARVAYYTLLKGDKWLQEEKERVAKSEAQPVVDAYLAKQIDLSNRITQQKSTIEIMNGVKDKVLSVEDDMQFSVSAFSKQIGAIRNQINMDKKKQVETVQQAGSWINTLLNWLIVLTTLIAILLMVRYFMRRQSAFSVPGSTPLPR